MDTDMLDLYDRASAWTNTKVAGATTKLDAPTPCEDWDVRTLLNHMLDTQRYFASSARGENPSMPSPNPPPLLSDNPVADFTAARDEMLRIYSEPGVVERTGPALGIALCDQLLHGWDLAEAIGDETAMPEGLAQAAYGMLHGQLPDERRPGMFAPEIPVDSDASAQEKLLAYTGRQPG